MILSSAPTNEAVLSNVGSVTEFTIKATAKSFSILSSGLYANKIRAIIREPSCNALDSHVANGNVDVPFVVHLPNTMEPYFSVRDFGTGLSAEQVTSIFTSFFTSTKTDSNDFVGALGLGSKSPFSYTDNFTITAVKDGVKGIYTAFINEIGVPSIALMMSEETTEPSGVEIKFAVNDRYDFGKFRDEAQYVFKYWKNRPIITGHHGFQFIDPDYNERDLIKGVHSLNNTNRYDTTSYALMGNIPYPIDIPNADESIGDICSLLKCNLVMEFDIGELDFQASREGLSYVPLTINSIKSKLEKVNAQLAVRLASDADKIDNLWERCDFLQNKIDSPLWREAIKKYVFDTNFPLIDMSVGSWDAVKRFDLSVDDLATKFNITIKSFIKTRGKLACDQMTPDVVRVNGEKTQQWRIRSMTNQFFVFNDTKVGALERAKHHWRNLYQGNEQKTYTQVVYVIEPFDKTKPIAQADFLDSIMNPPSQNVMKVSSLISKKKNSGTIKEVPILKLSKNCRSEDSSSWDVIEDFDFSDTTTTRYYVPLSGFTSLGKFSNTSILARYIKQLGIYDGPIYGVRKSNIETIKKMSNWVEIDTMVESKLSSFDGTQIMGVVKDAIDFDRHFHWKITNMISPSSKYAEFVSVFEGVGDIDRNKSSVLGVLFRAYNVPDNSSNESETLITKYTAQRDEIYARYPLLSSIGRYSASAEAVADYINMVDNKNSENA